MTTHRQGPDGWLFTADAAALHPEGASVVVADVHLGYEWARANAGDALPPYTLARILPRLETLFQRHETLIGAPPRRLVVVGDLLESPNPGPRALRDLEILRRTLERRNVQLLPLRGNHDHPRVAPQTSLRIAGWTLHHGHQPLTPEPDSPAPPKTLVGHHHPALRWDPLAPPAPCFLAGPRLVVLPAFSPDAAGVDPRALPPALLAADPELRCLPIANADPPEEPTILDFGPLARLLPKLQALAPTSPAPPRGPRAGRDRRRARTRPQSQSESD